MTRQKLPEECGYDDAGSVMIPGRNGTNTGRVYIDTFDKELTIERDWDNPREESAPATVALAVIRNAGLDPVYEAAKEFVSCLHNPNRSWQRKTEELAKLIASLEE
jgi:hypothetical protein